MRRTILLSCILALCSFQMAAAQANAPAATGLIKYDHRVLATTRTSTMEKEMNEAADSGYRFLSVMGGETGVGGKEVVVVMGKEIGPESRSNKRYKLLATSRTSTMQKELQQAGDEGFEYRGQTVFESGLAGREVAVILERDADSTGKRIEYRLLATTRTSTMQKELVESGEAGFSLAGLTVSKTAFGGSELVCILQRSAR